MANQVLRTTFWNVLMSNLFRGAEFLKYAVSHDAYVNDTSVEIPQAGSVAAVSVDQGNPVLPLPIAVRADGKRSYDLNNFRIAPTLIEHAEELETSYNKAADVLRNHIDKLNQEIGDFGAHAWGIDPAVDATRRILSTGTASAKTLLPGMTGTRKAISIDDLADARAVLGQDNVPETDNFYCLMPSKTYWNFLSDNASVLDQDFMNKGNLPDGIVAKVHGWYIFNRGETLRYTGAGAAKKAFGSANAATDEAGIVCWNANYVARALGSVKVFMNDDRPEYQGDLFSSLIRFSNVVLRNDLKGVVTIVQTA